MKKPSLPLGNLGSPFTRQGSCWSPLTAPHECRCGEWCQFGLCWLTGWYYEFIVRGPFIQKFARSDRRLGLGAQPTTILHMLVLMPAAHAAQPTCSYEHVTPSPPLIKLLIPRGYIFFLNMSTSTSTGYVHSTRPRATEAFYSLRPTPTEPQARTLPPLVADSPRCRDGLTAREKRKQVISHLCSSSGSSSVPLTQTRTKRKKKQTHGDNWI